MSCLEQGGHLAALREVPQQLREEADVGLRVQQVLVAQLLGLLVADGLLEGRCAGAALVHEAVVDHVAHRALQVLHLVGNNSPVE